MPRQNILSGMSPEKVAADPRFQVQHSHNDPYRHYPQCEWFVVQELATGKYWAVAYWISDDRSDYDLPTSAWRQVERTERVVVEFK